MFSYSQAPKKPIYLVTNSINKAQFPATPTAHCSMPNKSQKQKINFEKESYSISRQKIPTTNYPILQLSRLINIKIFKSFSYFFLRWEQLSDWDRGNPKTCKYTQKRIFLLLNKIGQNKVWAILNMCNTW